MKAAYAYGQYLGNRYKGYSNVAWLNGNDFNLWTIPEDDKLVQAVSKGIRSVAPNQLQTVELNVRTSSSFDDPRWIPLIELNSTYTYSPTYIQMLHSYNQYPAAPAYLVEGHYDWEDVGEPPDFGTPYVLRKQDYWTILTGGTGQFYGNKYTWSFADGWKEKIDTPGVEQLGIWKKFFSSLPWQDLVPDQDHKVLTAGFGTFGNVDTRVSESDYATAAKTSDGSAIVVYVPTVRAITIDMSCLPVQPKRNGSIPAMDPTRMLPAAPSTTPDPRNSPRQARTMPETAIGSCCCKPPAQSLKSAQPAAVSNCRPHQRLDVTVLLFQQAAISRVHEAAPGQSVR